MDLNKLLSLLNRVIGSYPINVQSCSRLFRYSGKLAPVIKKERILFIRNVLLELQNYWEKKTWKKECDFPQKVRQFISIQIFNFRKSNGINSMQNEYLQMLYCQWVNVCREKNSFVFSHFFKKVLLKWLLPQNAGWKKECEKK